jgi:formylglycine-generating enzyme required for sulfatase activity
VRTPDEERERLARGVPPDWASAWGEDEYGVFACFEVSGAEQRMRWIERGMFLMGSPEGEVGRFSNEGPQHEVTLTQGYWLADTPCTQELWQAVMGSNPSSHQSPRRPVEQVSWEDVQGFLEKLNTHVEGLHAALPTEAQWEHACRAGTMTATYAGDLSDETRDAVLDDIAWYYGNHQGHTQDVGLKRPNPWGLHDMLGNVWEWCADLQREYTAQAVTDPVGTRGPRRVDRGGGWLSFARFVRAANRNWLAPGYRYGSLGFRLVRGQVKPGPEAEEQGREQGRGTSPASPGGRRKNPL